ncbi:MAG: protein-glutamate O-methyltransferase CheR [Hyphomicrobiales bacterium]
MTPQDFDYLREMLKTRSGLVLSEEKKYLVESRLLPLARENGLDSLSALVGALKSASGELLRRRATEAMTINESFFYRDKTPFENFRNIMVPALKASKGASRRLRIWCAASSSGQEPYSLAMEIREMGPALAGWNIEIVGTDICSEVLEKARTGLYSQFEVQRGLPIQMLVKYFKQTGTMWQIDASIRAMVRYTQFNLLETFSQLGTFDIVFCRNVLIYFDADTKRDILMRISRQLAPDGFLVLGAAETVIGLTDAFATMREARGLYRHANAPQLPASAASPAANAATLRPTGAPAAMPAAAAKAG